MEELEKLGYKLVDTKVDGGVNHEIQDSDGEIVAWIMINDDGTVEDWECQHPEDITEFGDDDECGVCPICGAFCSWFWRKTLVDEGHDEDGNYTGTMGEVRDITEWWNKTPEEFEGVFGELISDKNEI